IKQLRAQLQALGERTQGQAGLYEEEEEEQEPERSCVALRGHADMRLHSGGRDVRRKQVSKVGAWACMLVTPAAAEVEEKDEKVGAGACVPATAEAEEKDEQVGARVCVPAAAEAEVVDEGVEARACVVAAAEEEGKEEKVGAQACEAAAAEEEGKEEKEGAQACVAAAAEEEGKEEKVGAQARVVAAAVAERKAKKKGAWACAPAAAEAGGKDEKVGARARVLKAEKQAQESGMAEQQVRKLWGEHPELKGEEMGKEAMRGPEADVRSITAEAACHRGQADLWVARWEGPTVKGIKGETWEDESMEPATQVLTEPAGMRVAENWVAWDREHTCREGYAGSGSGYTEKRDAGPGGSKSAGAEESEKSVDGEPPDECCSGEKQPASARVSSDTCTGDPSTSSGGGR
ncbi:unnamed protein product, partial [Closterium sp. NIES-53]